MNWTPEIVEEAEVLFATHNAHEIAGILSAKYGERVTHDNVRAVFSRYGIKDPKDSFKQRKVVMYAVRYQYPVSRIAELMGCSEISVCRILSDRAPGVIRAIMRNERDRRRAAYLHTRKRLSTERIAEIIRRGKGFVKKVVKAIYVQLSLFEEPVMSIAA
jgi:transposase